MDNINNTKQTANILGNQDTMSEQNMPESEYNLNEELFTIPFFILTAEAHNILFQWLEKQSESRFSRDNFSVNKIYKKYYGSMVFWFTKKSDGESAYNSLSPQKEKEILVIPGNTSVPSEVTALAHNYDFMKLADLDPKNLEVTDYLPIQITEKEAEEKAFAKLKKIHPDYFDAIGNLKPGIELEASFPMALPFWEGTYSYKGGRDFKFFINGENGEIDGEHYTGKTAGRGLALPFDMPDFSSTAKYYIIIAITLALILLMFVISKMAHKENPSPIPSPTTSISVSATPKASESPVAPAVTTAGATTQTPAASPTPLASQTAAPANTAQSEASQKEAVAKVVEDNFKFITEKKYQDILDLRTEEIKKINSTSTYEERYTDNVSINTDKITVESADPEHAQVVAAYTSIDKRQGAEQTSKGEIRFYLIKENGKWLINDSQQLSEEIISSESSNNENTEATGDLPQ